MQNFDELRSKKDIDTRLRLAKDFDSQLRLAKDFAQGLWVQKKKPAKKKQPTRQELEELARREEEARKKREDEELDRFLQLLTFILCVIYALGWEETEKKVGKIDVDWNHDLDSVDAEIDGLTFEDRIRDCETYEEVERIIDTEAHRDYNAGAFEAAKASGKPNLLKTWRTMNDDLVRDSHVYLEGVTVGLDDYFYTAGGHYALYPGQFGVSDEDVNCRCVIEITEQ